MQKDHIGSNAVQVLTMINKYKICSEILKEIDQLGDIGVEGRVILRLIINM
jgi:hypothetical protein